MMNGKLFILKFFLLHYFINVYIYFRKNLAIIIDRICFIFYLLSLIIGSICFIMNIET